MTPHTATLTTLALAGLLFACGGGGGSGGGGGGSCGALLAAAPGGGAAVPLEAVGNEVVLQLQSSAIDIDDLASDFGLTRLSQFGSRPIHRLRIAAGVDVEAVVAQLVADSARVRYAEPNLVGAAPESRRCSVWTIGEASQFAAQWAPQALRLDAAQALSSGVSAGGERVRVAVLDTGVDLAHPALSGRLARTAGGALLGRDFVDDDASPTEVGGGADVGFGHGTHVAGLVGLVAPQARIMPVRVLDRGGQGNAWVLAEGLLWAIDPDRDPLTDDGAHVVNLSLGTLRPTRLLEDVVRLASCDFDDDDDEGLADAGFDDDRARCAARHGAVVLAAAGNSGSATEAQYPAAEAQNVPGALAVTASTEDRRLADFANRGPWVQVAAPGEGLTSAIPGGGYGVWSGTSMAAPLAAGTAALVMATESAPDPAGQAGLRRWTPLDIAKRLSDRSAKLCGDTSLRQIDAYAAVTDGSAPDPDC